MAVQSKDIKEFMLKKGIRYISISKQGGKKRLYREAFINMSSYSEEFYTK